MESTKPDLSDSAFEIASALTADIASIIGSGNSLEEFTLTVRAILKHKAPPVGSPVYERVFTILDSNHDGKVDMIEFMTGLVALSKGTINDKATLVFKFFDQNHDGYISKTECEEGCVRVFSNSLDFSQNEEAKKALAEAGLYEEKDKVSLRDSQQNRKVKYHDLVQKIKENVHHMFESDDNKDGRLSMDEWVRHVKDNPALRVVVDFYTL